MVLNSTHLNLGRDKRTVQPRRHSVDIGGDEDGLREDQHGLQRCSMQ